MHVTKRLIGVFVTSFILINHSYPQEVTFIDQDCLWCHGKPNIAQIMKSGKVRSVFINPEEWSQDVHSQGGMVCVDCHINASPYLHFREGFIDVECARCHPEEAEEYQKNIHLTFKIITSGKELPSCHHCHTRHHVLPHDDLSSSINETNIGQTCGNCHAEVMVKGILKGASLGKISGHRKGDLAERFDMQVCINCHYEDSAHGSKRAYKDFCSRCHEYRSKTNPLIGPIHLDSTKMSYINYLGGSLFLLLLIGTCVYIGYSSRTSITRKIKSWFASVDKEVTQKQEQAGTHEEKGSGQQ